MGSLSFKCWSSGRAKKREVAPGNICLVFFNNFLGQPVSLVFLENKKLFEEGAIVTHGDNGATSA